MPPRKELKDLDLRDKYAAAFGSYGWSGEAVEVIQDYLKQTNMKVIDSSFIIKSTGMDNAAFPIRVKFAPNEEKSEAVINAAKIVGDILVQ